MERTIIAIVLATICMSFGTGCSSSQDTLHLNTAGISTVTRDSVETPKKKELWPYYNGEVRSYKLREEASDFIDRDFTGIATHPTSSSPYHPSECRILSFKRICVEINDATKSWLAGLEFHF